MHKFIAGIVYANSNWVSSLLLLLLLLLPVDGPVVHGQTGAVVEAGGEVQEAAPLLAEALTGPEVAAADVATVPLSLGTEVGQALGTGVVVGAGGVDAAHATGAAHVAVGAGHLAAVALKARGEA